jgi:hypothetical protein
MSAVIVATWLNPAVFVVVGMTTSDQSWPTLPTPKGLVTAVTADHRCQRNE